MLLTAESGGLSTTVTAVRSVFSLFTNEILAAERAGAPFFAIEITDFRAERCAGSCAARATRSPKMKLARRCDKRSFPHRSAWLRQITRHGVSFGAVLFVAEEPEGDPLAELDGRLIEGIDRIERRADDGR